MTDLPAAFEEIVQIAELVSRASTSSVTLCLGVSAYDEALEIKMSVDLDMPDEFDEPDPELNRITRLIIGAAIEVHRHLGGGHLESAYEEALAVEMDLRGIRYARQLDIALIYKGHTVGKGRLDFLVEDRVIIDLKSVRALNDAHATQMISYLAITGHPLGLIINFNVGQLRNGIRRIAGRSRLVRKQT